MASGDTLGVLSATDNKPPAATFATLDSRAGGSTPAENLCVLDFDTTTQEYADFLFELPNNYAGGGLTVTIVWMATTATSGEVVWAAAFRRLVDDAEDIDASHTYDYNSIGAGATAPSLSGEQGYDNITFTDGADMDSLATGEFAILRISRDTADADDDMAGDAELIGIIVKET